MKFSPIVYLLGAGASIEAKVPGFEKCWEAMDKHFGFSQKFSNPQSGLTEYAFEQIKKSIMELSENEKTNFESLCRLLRFHSKELMEQGNSNNIEDLKKARGCIEAEYAIRDYFVRLIDIDFASTLGHDDKQDRYFNIFNQRLTDIFTLNNDLLIEYLAKRKGIPICDGFSKEGIFSTMQYEKFSEGVRLYKLHGSINWRRNGPSIVKQYRPGSFRSVIKFGNSSEQTWNIPLVWPGVYEEMPEMEDIIEKYLVPAVRQAKCLVIAGYKMGDHKIRENVTKAIRSWSKGTAHKVIIICGQNYAQSLTEWIKEIKQEKNVIVETKNGFYLPNTKNNCKGCFPNILINPQFINVVKSALDEKITRKSSIKLEVVKLISSHINGTRFICCAQRNKIFVLSNPKHGRLTQVVEIDITSGTMKNILILWGITPTGFDISKEGKIAITYGGISFGFKSLSFLYGLSGGLLITSKGCAASVWATLKIIWHFIEILSSIIFVLIKGLYKRKIIANDIKDEIKKIKFHGSWSWPTGVKFDSDPINLSQNLIVATATTIYQGNNDSGFEAVQGRFINCVNIAPIKPNNQFNYLLFEGHLHVPDLWIKNSEKMLGAIWLWNSQTLKLWKGFINNVFACAAVADKENNRIWICYLKLNTEGQHKCYLSLLDNPSEEFECETLDNPYYISDYYEDRSFLVCDNDGIKIVKF